MIDVHTRPVHWGLHCLIIRCVERQVCVCVIATTGAALDDLLPGQDLFGRGGGGEGRRFVPALTHMMSSIKGPSMRD